MELIEIYNDIGIENYTVLCLVGGMIFSFIFDILNSISNYFLEKSLYIHDKRKELKKLK